QPEIVLMDVRMPNMDGMEATRRIKIRLPSVSVIVLTAFDSEAYIVDAIRSGAVGYLPKESSKDLLIHSIRAVNSGGMLIKSSLFRQAVLSWSDTGDAQVKEKSAANVMLEELTPRERDVLWHMIDGRTNGEIGKVLFIGEDTAKKHVQAILHKLGVSDRTQAAVKAVRLGLSDLLPGPKHS
ncbi:MAG: response regulator transcription factor, partial [Dehalococcoidia bacterium]|nr:response regulator transcription factor [Dehalococcoidia bacterium]